MPRLTLDETWNKLGDQMPRDADGRPRIPAAMPSYDDEEPLFSFFREGLSDADFSDCTLPRMFFGRSELERCSFQNADLSESRMCWNDFTECDFGASRLQGCDLRSSNFQACSFARADLRGTDLRSTQFTDCDFTDADLTGAVCDLEETHRVLVPLITEAQRTSMIWHRSAGPEAPGG